MLLVRQEDSTVPLFDTTRLHVEAAIARALTGPLMRTLSPRTRLD
jgi:aspartate/glutamate racemase